MPGRWNDEWRAEGYGRGVDRERGRWDDRGRDRWEGGEDRSFGRDRVFGERDSGMGYNQPRDIPSRPVDYRAGDYRVDEDRPDWQDRDYQGVSPAFAQHERDYESGYRAYPGSRSQTYGRGGRFYGDDGRERVFRDEYAYGASPQYRGGRRDEGRRFGAREADERYQRELDRRRYRTFSGGTGGYDYERGYGDGGRGEDRGRREEGFESRARDAGEFFRRTGRKVANWFSDVAGEGSDMGRNEERGARGLGPKGYKRSDDRISDEVHQRLTDDPWLDASEIDATVANGEVTLSGKVESREAKHRAEHIVEDLSGVTHVQNNLRVRPYGAEGRMRTEGDGASETSATGTTRGRA
jgi:osmotically-inducible protein OsmY